MITLPKHLNDIIDILASFPGLGRKSSRRILFHVLAEGPHVAARLADSLKEMHEKTYFCRNCGCISDSEKCSVCSDASRNKSILCVVENFIDQIVLESTNFYDGQYHVLGGVLSPLDGMGPEKLSIDKLVARIGGNEIREVIIATNPTPEGNATALYIAELISDFNVKITRLGRGIPVGGDIDLLDLETIRLSLEGRIEIKKQVD
ncbi:recombination protein RecR [candidate division WOR-3 bacterium]|nr:recombination protein RecR [candidate division WOR-3 bacterium]